MTKNENEILDNIIIEITQCESNAINNKLKISEKRIKEFYERIPNLVENTPYTEDISELVNSIVEKENKKLLMEIDEYLDEVVKNRKNPLIPIWIAMFVIFVFQLFLLLT
ncbi:MAG: hypothetical protein LBJ88_04820 [Campylobacteraceae bacterium]|jgi:Fe2+ transport system protein B|nr:hypothetical protein [Campylobacteraceae bacterium]